MEKIKMGKQEIKNKNKNRKIKNKKDKNGK